MVSNVFSHVTWQLPVMVMLTLSMTLSGCQKNAEPMGTADEQRTDTQATHAPTTSHQVSTPVTTDHVSHTSLTILALGDSLTEGLGVAGEDNYPAQLEDRLQEMGYTNAKVINSGLSGETSTGLINRLDWVIQTKPDITILTIGANDAMRGLEVTLIEANIRTAITRLQDSGSQVILGGMQIYDNLGNDYVAAFSEIYPRVAKDMNVPLIPFFLDGVGGDPTLNQADAIHPTKEGYTVIVNDNILPVLQPEIETLPTHLPTETTR